MGEQDGLAQVSVGVPLYVAAALVRRRSVALIAFAVGARVMLVLLF